MIAAIRTTVQGAMLRTTARPDTIRTIGRADTIGTTAATTGLTATSHIEREADTTTELAALRLSSRSA